MAELLAAMESFLLDMAASPLVLPVVMLLCAGDAFLPPVPSETVLVALAAARAPTSGLFALVLIPVAAAGAWLGDAAVYWLGRGIGVSRWRWMRHPKTARSVQFARDALQRRGILLIMTARFIPVGRVAVNLTAGATSYPWRRFASASGCAALVWAAYTVGIGALFGHWLGGQPLLATLLGIATAILIGVLADRLVNVLVMRRVERPLR